MKYNIGDIIEYEHDTTKEWRVVVADEVTNWKGINFGEQYIACVNLLKDGTEGKKSMTFFSYNDITTRKISVRRSYHA